MSDQEPICDMLWLAKGEVDPFENYLFRKREELPMANFTDDQLANYAFMNYNRGAQDEYRAMMSSLLEPQYREYPKIAFMTAVKERMRWLSRRLALVEGRYPLAKLYIPDDYPRTLWCPPDLLKGFNYLKEQGLASDVVFTYSHEESKKREAGLINDSYLGKKTIVRLSGVQWGKTGKLYEIPYTGPNNFADFSNVEYTYRKPENKA